MVLKLYPQCLFLFRGLCDVINFVASFALNFLPRTCIQIKALRLSLLCMSIVLLILCYLFSFPPTLFSLGADVGPYEVNLNFHLNLMHIYIHFFVNHLHDECYYLQGSCIYRILSLYLNLVLLTIIIFNSTNISLSTRGESF